MAKLSISIQSENFETTATLLEDEAPKTCKAISGVLPIEGNLMHAMISGNETLIELQGQTKVKLEPENWIFSYIPGDICYWHSLWGDGRYLKDIRDNAEITFIYGRHVRVRDLALRETGANLFARFDSKLDEFARICKKTRLEGVQKIKMELVR
ncbi:MAG: DUF3830 family protein [Nitrososphaerales archaeon]